MKNPNEELELYREVYAITGDIIYRYSIADDTMLLYNGNDVNSRLGTTINNFVKMLRSQNFQENDRRRMEKYIEALSSGNLGFFENEVRLKLDASLATRYKVIGKTVYDAYNAPVYVVGKLIPVEDSSSLARNRTVNRKNIDELTGILKPSEFKKQISAKCSERNGMQGGVIVISVSDTDKSVTPDSETLLDNLYINIVQRLRRLFYYNAVIGRIKQDEFAVVYYGDDISTGFIEKVNELKDAVNGPDIAGIAKDVFSVQGGVYCGIFSDRGIQNILKKASMAMEFARYGGGENRICMYTPDMEDLFHTYGSENVRIRNAEIKIEHKLIKNTLEVLSDSEDINHTIEEMFSIVGREFNIDKIIMYEFDIHKLKMSVSAYWDKAGGDLPAPKNTDIDYRTIDWFNSKTEMAVVNDVSKLEVPGYRMLMTSEGIKSFVAAGFQTGTVAGCVVFKSSGRKRKWTQSELKVFELVRRIISTCLINMRLYYEMLQNAKDKNNTDALTGLYKYNVFLEEASKYIACHRNEQLAVINIRLDGFFRINEFYGYETGDDILKKYVKVIENNKERFIMGSRLNADNLVALVNLFDDRGRMLSEATINMLYNGFIEECSAKYPAAELKITSGITQIKEDGREVSDYVAYASKLRAR